ncbi:hypothetical protein [Nocardia mexicana]|uniref:ABC-2 family transporter n=1 Tax=Nocardia mexicana TaxID=279262 RepID=A0A370H1E2_9NOCA|nr:hypothetical protein [Nocardia mexicana]RDI49836.1 hypothetical protein DFR68_106273 [Nocardia mexicana]
MTSHQLRHVAGHLLTPLLMCVGMGLAYLGAFHQPEPNHLKVALVGDTAQVKVLAQTMKDTAGDKLEVVTLPTRDEAVHQLQDRDLAGAYVPEPGHPELLVAKADSDTTAMAVETVFGQVAAQQHAPLTTTDITTHAPGDPTGQGLFFLLVALSIGSYGSVAAIGAAGAGMGIGLRALCGLVTSLIVSVIGIALAGPVFHVIDHDYAQVWAMGWLYSAGILTIGIGLHTFLKRWTTLALMALFVMLNFTTSGGVYGPALQNDFFGALHSFWNGAGFVEGARSLLYFDGTGFGGRIASLALWFAGGLVLLVIAGMYERRAVNAGTDEPHGHHAADSPAPATPEPADRRTTDQSRAAEEEMEEAVGV